jgi:hypothetical protein
MPRKDWDSTNTHTGIEKYCPKRKKRITAKIYEEILNVLHTKACVEAREKDLENTKDDRVNNTEDDRVDDAEDDRVDDTEDDHVDDTEDDHVDDTEDDHVDDTEDDS